MTMAERVPGLDWPLFYQFTEPMAPALCQFTWITPDLISFFHGVVITSIAVWNFYRYKSLLGFCALMYVRSFLDALDGDVARECQNGNAWGGQIDTALDFIPAIILGVFAWINVPWQADHHKYVLFGFILVAGYFVSDCQHDPHHSTFCYLYYPNACSVGMAFASSIKYLSMRVRQPAAEVHGSPPGSPSKERADKGGQWWG